MSHYPLTLGPSHASVSGIGGTVVSAVTNTNGVLVTAATVMHQATTPAGAISGFVVDGGRFLCCVGPEAFANLSQPVLIPAGVALDYGFGNGGFGEIYYRVL